MTPSQSAIQQNCVGLCFYKKILAWRIFMISGEKIPWLKKVHNLIFSTKENFLPLEAFKKFLEFSEMFS